LSSLKFQISPFLQIALEDCVNWDSILTEDLKIFERRRKLTKAEFGPHIDKELMQFCMKELFRVEDCLFKISSSSDVNMMDIYEDLEREKRAWFEAVVDLAGTKPSLDLMPTKVLFKILSLLDYSSDLKAAGTVCRALGRARMMVDLNFKMKINDICDCGDGCDICFKFLEHAVAKKYPVKERLECELADEAVTLFRKKYQKYRHKRLW
jgi:hypothetical protein